MSIHDKLRDFLHCFNGNGNRSKVLAYLHLKDKTETDKEATVSAIIEFTNLEQAIVSIALKELREQDIVIPRRKGKYIYYKLNTAKFKFYEKLLYIAEEELI